MHFHTILVFISLLGLSFVQPGESTEVNVTASKEPKIIDQVEQLNHEEGTNAIFTCSIGSGELEGLTYEWLKDDKRLTPATNPNKFTFILTPGNFQSLLRVVDLKPSDSGVYSCIAKNRFGQDKISTRLTVKVQLKWIEEPLDVESSVGKSIHIPCKAEGTPQPRIEWMRLTGNKNKDREVIGSELRLSELKQDDGGTYECRARNGADKDLVARVNLKVLGEY